MVLSGLVTAKYSIAFNGNEPNQQQPEKRHHTDISFKDNFNLYVSKMCDMFDVTFTDPFSNTNPSPRLVNFETGVMVTEVSEASLLNVHVEGEAMLQNS